MVMSIRLCAYLQMLVEESSLPLRSLESDYAPGYQSSIIEFQLRTASPRKHLALPGA
jgi:hypothetical protein